TRERRYEARSIVSETNWSYDCPLRWPGEDDATNGPVPRGTRPKYSREDMDARRVTEAEGPRRAGSDLRPANHATPENRQKRRLRQLQRLHVPEKGTIRLHPRGLLPLSRSRGTIHRPTHSRARQRTKERVEGGTVASVGPSCRPQGSSSASSVQDCVRACRGMRQGV